VAIYVSVAEAHCIYTKLSISKKTIVTKVSTVYRQKRDVDMDAFVMLLSMVETHL
jgi:hypothetical protein